MVGNQLTPKEGLMTTYEYSTAHIMQPWIAIDSPTQSNFEFSFRSRMWHRPVVACVNLLLKSHLMQVELQHFGQKKSFGYPPSTITLRFAVSLTRSSPIIPPAHKPLQTETLSGYLLIYVPIEPKISFVAENNSMEEERRFLTFFRRARILKIIFYFVVRL